MLILNYHISNIVVATKMASDSELPDTPPAAEAEAEQATEKPGKRNACNNHHYTVSTDNYALTSHFSYRVNDIQEQKVETDRASEA